MGQITKVTMGVGVMLQDKSLVPSHPLSLISQPSAPINVNPVGGGGEVRARGGDLTAKSIPSVGGSIEYLCSGVGTFEFFDRETGTKIKRSYLASSFLALKSQVVS